MNDLKVLCNFLDPSTLVEMIANFAEHLEDATREGELPERAKLEKSLSICMDAVKSNMGIAWLISELAKRR